MKYHVVTESEAAILRQMKADWTKSKSQYIPQTPQLFDSSPKIHLAKVVESGGIPAAADATTPAWGAVELIGVNLGSGEAETSYVRTLESLKYKSSTVNVQIPNACNLDIATGYAENAVVVVVALSTGGYLIVDMQNSKPRTVVLDNDLDAPTDPLTGATSVLASILTLNSSGNLVDSGHKLTAVNRSDISLVQYTLSVVTLIDREWRVTAASCSPLTGWP